MRVGSKQETWLKGTGTLDRQALRCQSSSLIWVGTGRAVLGTFLPAAPPNRSLLGSATDVMLGAGEDPTTLPAFGS